MALCMFDLDGTLGHLRGGRAKDDPSRRTIMRAALDGAQAPRGDA